MPTLEKRLEALEANTPHIPDRVTLVTFVKPGELDKEIQRICTALVADEGQQWIRESGRVCRILCKRTIHRRRKPACPQTQ